MKNESAPNKNLASTTSTYFGPAWDNRSYYPAVSSKEWQNDIAKCEVLTDQIATLSRPLTPWLEKDEIAYNSDSQPIIAVIGKIFDIRNDLITILRNLNVFAQCASNVDASDQNAKRAVAEVTALTANAENVMITARTILDLASEPFLDALFATSGMASHEFQVRYRRSRKQFRLPPGEESLLTTMEVDGFLAWGTLYSTLAGSLKCTIENADGTLSHIGLAKASALRESLDENTRRAAQTAADAAWRSAEESCSAALNAITGWRHEVYKRRSHTVNMHYIDQALHDSRITRATLETLMSCLRKHRNIGQQALRLRARALGKKQLAYWDLFAACPGDPTGNQMRFADAIDMIAEAYGAVHADMGDFVRMMAEKRWIEGTVTDLKRPGGYCTTYASPRQPRIYMTYTGGMKDVVTLAHELGHAWHNWVMRDLPLELSSYPMTLAETASIFGETLVQVNLLARAQSAHDRLKVSWGDAREAEGFLLNIPARFDFEIALNERRRKSPLTPDDLRAMTREAWSNWYGDSLSEMDEMFWASKLHFYITRVSFYNFPYTFGLLFALGVYAMRDQLGSSFYQSYCQLLRDTGNMTAEEVAKKHLGVNLEEPDFWERSLAIMSNKVKVFEKTLGEAGF